MTSTFPLPDLSGHTAIVPGGTGSVGEGVVRRLLAAGADVVVPTRSIGREREFRDVLGDAAGPHLHLVVHDYSSFGGARELIAETARRLGGVDHVVAPIGGWWAGTALHEIDETDWETAFVGLATTHMAMLRAALPVLSQRGSYSVVVGDSAAFPVPGSGLVSMEQAAVLMMQRVAAAEQSRRVLALLLGPVRTRVAPGVADGISADDVGSVAAAIAAAPAFGARTVPLHDAAEVAAALRSATS